MAPVSLARAGLALVLLAAAASCSGGPYPLTWEIRPGATMPLAIRLEILRGDCTTSTDVVWSEDVTPSTTMTGAPAPLDAGTYCLRARGVDAACELVGWARAEVTLPRHDAAPVVLTLDRDATTTVPPICASRPCSDPICAGDLGDAGLDAAQADGSVGDAGARDAGMDVGLVAMDAPLGRDAFVPPDAMGCPHAGSTAPSGGPPVGTRPWSGWTTGSLTASTATTFEWSSVAGADCYELALTDECVPGRLDTCAFAAASLQSTSASSIAIVLDTSSTSGAPVGRRWYWRTRACANAGGCTGWGTVRYLDAGRSRSDLDGDGTPDLVVVGAHPDDTLGLIAQLRGPSPITEIVLTLPDATGGVTALGQGLTTCDIDGDGYAEIIAAAPTAPYSGRTAAGRVFVFRGPPSAGASSAPRLGQGLAGAQMGASVACGDVNNDGFADVIIGGPGGAGRVEVHLGNDTTLVTDDAGIVLARGSASGSSGFGTSIAVGDVTPGASGSPDGIVDIFVGAPTDRSVFGYRGVDTGSSLATTPFLDAGIRAMMVDTFAETLLVADFDATPGADLIVGAPASASAATGGAVYFVSSPTWGTSRAITPIGIPHHGGFGARFGAALAVVRSADPSVRAALLVGAPGADRGTSDDVGATFRIAGSATGPTVVPSPTFSPGGYFGRAVAADVIGSRGGVVTVGSEAGTGAVWELDSGDFITPIYYRSTPFDGTAVAFGGL